MIMVPVMEFIKDLMEFRLIMYGALMIIVMIYYPKGFVGLWETAKTSIRNKRKSLTMA